MRRALNFTCAFGMLASLAGAQSVDATPVKIGDAVVSSSVRTRMYSWNWFGDTPNGDYTYSGSLLRFGLAESRQKLDWQVEFAVPAPLGQLGLGGSYAAANSGSTNSSSIFLKQGSFRIKGIGVPRSGGCRRGRGPAAGRTLARHAAVCVARARAVAGTEISVAGRAVFDARFADPLRTPRHVAGGMGAAAENRGHGDARHRRSPVPG